MAELNFRTTIRVILDDDGEIQVIQPRTVAGGYVAVFVDPILTFDLPVGSIASRIGAAVEPATRADIFAVGPAADLFRRGVHEAHNAAVAHSAEMAAARGRYSESFGGIAS